MTTKIMEIMVTMMSSQLKGNNTNLLSSLRRVATITGTCTIISVLNVIVSESKNECGKPLSYETSNVFKCILTANLKHL